jgi:hypothetical protein
MFKINSLTPQPITTKFGVVTIHNQTKNIGYKRIYKGTLGPESDSCSEGTRLANSALSFANYNFINIMP